MPAAVQYVAFLAAADESDQGFVCSACSSDHLIGIDWYGPTGVVAPDGGEEYRSQEGYKCLVCGAIEEV